MKDTKKTTFRRLVGWVVAMSLFAGSAVAYGLTQDELTEIESARADVAAAQASLDSALATLDALIAANTTTTTQPTTTTTQPTTTTTQPTTTTTQPTTTTTAPTTTTTAPSSSLPATIPHPSLTKDIGYEFTVDDITNAPNLVKWWDAPYLFNLPYEDGYGWAAGDRCAYRGVYGFLIAGGTKVAIDNQFDLNGGSVIGRFHAASIRDNVGDLYIRLSDGFMREGSRHFNGTLDRNSSVSPEPGFDECPDPSEAYTAYNGPDQRPVIAFRNAAGEVVEIRDYRTTQTPEANIIFRVADGDGSDDQVAVTAHDLDNGGLPGVVVYYDALGNGSVELWLDGVKQ